jgi:eukaryotic-like serine/threonine-protein kinase
MPLISDSIGRVLGKRYRLLSALGTGASAHVFLAEDVSLQRYVAVKVLQPGLASDESFLRRFGAEARSVASLNHPHVLRVFDWGEDADGPYLVLEYLGGGSLRDMFDRGTRLSHAQAAKLGTEVAEGLAYAHARGLVHRDIKPANLLFDEEGLVRVADFGVARALAEASYTEQPGSMVGTAKYISPEAAEGKVLDGRADVYSLALVLYEAVTGTVPFVAETTIGTLMARVRAPLPPHPDLGPLDEVLARAAASDPSVRLDAAGLAARLGALAAALPLPEPLPLTVPEHPEVQPISGFRAPGVEELTQVVAAQPKSTSGAPIGTRAGPGELFDGAPYVDRTSHGGAPPPVAAAAVARRRRFPRRTAWIAAALVVVVAIVAGTLAALSGGVFTPSHKLPALASVSLTKARAELDADHFTVVVKPAVHSMIAAGYVISQSPKAGKKLKQGSRVTLVPSLGPPPVTVPNLVQMGLTCQTANAALVALHLTSACAGGQYNPTVPAGQLLEWTYGSQTDPTSVPYGAAVALVPSLGHAPVAVPPIPTTDTYAQAQTLLEADGFTTSQTSTTSTTVAAGDVIGTTPAAGNSAAFGSAVAVTVSSGPPTTQVPDLFQDTVSQATAALQQADLTVAGAYGPSAGSPNAIVIYTEPAQGVTVPDGSSVSLYTN